MAGRIPDELSRMGPRTSRILMATADARGTPHLASAGELACLPDDRVAVSYWFCPQTIANLGENPRCAVVAWNAERDEGYQLVGTVEEIREVGMLDGFGPGDGHDEPLPQVKHRVTIHVEKALEFKHAPHADTEIVPTAAEQR